MASVLMTDDSLPAFPLHGGNVGQLIRDFDWSSTPLGPIATWPQSLKSVTQMLLLSPVPLVLLWGDDGVMIYNDAYSEFAGERHPVLLGSKVREGWDEIRDFNDNVMRVGLSGETLAYRNQELTLQRRGYPEPAWMNLDYSPVLNEAGRPAGVIAIVVETTETVLTERKLAESERRFRALATATSDIIYQMSPDFEEMRHLEGRSRVPDLDVPSGTWIETYVLGDDRDEVLAAIDAAVAQGIPYQAEHRVVQADGSIGWVFSRAVPPGRSSIRYYSSPKRHLRAATRVRSSLRGNRRPGASSRLGTLPPKVGLAVLSGENDVSTAPSAGPSPLAMCVRPR